VKVTMMLADAAQAVGNKLYILGGGWSITAAGIPSAVALYFQVPWDLTSQRHDFRLELLTSDGEPFEDPDGGPLAIEGSFETGRPPGLKPGTPIDFALAVNVPPLPFEPDERYEWRLSVDGNAADDWRLAFSTRPAEPQGGPPFV
jgi:hypothetical protein